MSYADERLAAIRARNKRSKRRAGQMEREVASFLGGRRVPMSGAGSMKGDCEVETDKIGRIFIECKHSSQLHPKHGPAIRVDYRWLDKMHKDATSMRAKFAALVLKFHGSRLTSYVILSTDVLEKYGSLEHLSVPYEIDTDNASGITLYRHPTDELMATHGAILLHCNRGTYMIISIADFKEIIHGTNPIQ